jgi:RimJ/RimL family protein N-acetyltransferase
MIKDTGAILTRRCKMRYTTIKDAQQLMRILHDDDVKKFLPEFFEIASTHQDILNLIDSYSILTSRREAYWWVILKGDEVIGFISVIDIPALPTVFYAIEKSYRRNGYVFECLMSIISFLDNHASVTTLFSEVYKENHPSINILLSSGFKITEETSDKFKFQLSLKKNN